MTIHVSFLLVSGFQMAAYVLATDALRLANWRDGQPHFHCDVRTPDGAPAEANNGMVVAPDAKLGADPAPDAVFVCAGFSPERGCSKKVFTWLRALDRRGAVLGGWDTGPLILAEAGLMNGRQMALHWQAVPAVRERYPQIEITSDRCHVDRRRFTGPGGVTTLDLVLAYIAQTVSARVAQLVAESANRTAVIIEERHKPPSTSLFPGLLPPKLARVIATMEQEIETPSPIPSIALRSGLSERALYRAFREQLGVSPRTYYLNLRLERAKELLRQSDLSIAEIAAMTGFNSLSRFSQAFSNRFGEPPSRTRKRPSWLHVGDPSSDSERLVRTEPPAARRSTAND